MAARPRRTYLVALVALIVLAGAAVVVAAHTDPARVGSGSASGSGETAPKLAAKGWINSPPLTATNLAGKVVLYDFWTYSCVNCVRTLPHLRALYDRYRPDGLVVIGIHSPEFEFEKNHTNVADAVRKLGVDYPVALDDDHVIWDRFHNQYWPAHYVYDRNGHEADTHIGEGGYDETESLVRRLLGVPKTSPKAAVATDAGGPDGPPYITEETYNGAERGHAGFVSPEPLVPGDHTFTAPAKLDSGDHALEGAWHVAGEYVEARAVGAALDLRYVAGQVNLVLGTADGQPADVDVQIDGKPVRTISVTAPDLYELYRAPIAPHTLRLVARRPGVRAFAFTFGG